MPQEYVTVRGEAEDRFVERKSEFIGRIAPVSSEEEALAFLARVRQEHREARHNVYAYLLRSGVTRCSDDGEPQGTGGVPVLNVLQKEGLVDVCLVVTRYFGGILLGGGGLTRAYSHGASLAAAAADRLVMAPCREVSCTLDYSLYGKLSYLLPAFGAKTLESDFGQQVFLKVAVLEEQAAPLCREITEFSGGGAKLALGESFYLDRQEVLPQK